MATVFYWAGHYGERDIVLLFLEFLHVSPFAKLFRGSSVIDGCVQGHQLDLLRLLIEGTGKEGFKSKTDACRKKYILESKDLAAYYWKSRKGKNDLGNNTCHFAFEIDDEDLRYQVLELLVQESVGDIDKPNIKGLEPYEIEHDQPIRNFPPKLSTSFLGSKQEAEEADYLIICQASKMGIVVEQLKDLQLYHEDKK